MRTKETYQTLTAKIDALKEYLNNECTAPYFFGVLNTIDELLAIIDTLELSLSTLIDLNKFKTSIHLTKDQTRIIEIAVNKEYVTETYLAI